MEGAAIVSRSGIVFQTPDPGKFAQPYCDTIVKIQDELKKGVTTDESMKKVSELFGEASNEAGKNGNTSAADALAKRRDEIAAKKPESANIGDMLEKDCGFNLSSQVDPEIQKQLDAETRPEMNLIQMSEAFNPGQNSSLDLTKIASPDNINVPPSREQQALIHSAYPPFPAATSRVVSVPVMPPPESFIEYPDPIAAYKQAKEAYQFQQRIKYDSGSVPTPQTDPAQYSSGSCGTLYRIAQLYYPGLDEFPAQSIPLWRQAAAETVDDAQASASMSTIASFLETYLTFPLITTQNQTNIRTSAMTAGMASMQGFSGSRCGFEVFPSTLYR
jgi:hypothetical protein